MLLGFLQKMPLSFSIAQLKVRGEWGGVVANFDLSFQSHGYARVACEIATSIIFPPWFFLLRDTGCCMFPFHTRNSAFPWYCVALLSFQVMFVAVPHYSTCCRHSFHQWRGQAHFFTMLWNVCSALPVRTHAHASLARQDFCFGRSLAVAADPAAAGGERGARCCRDCSMVEGAGGCWGYRLSLRSLKLAQDFPMRPWLTRSLRAFLSAVWHRPVAARN